MRNVFGCLYSEDDSGSSVISAVSPEASRLLSALLKLAFSLGVDVCVP